MRPFYRKHIAGSMNGTELAYQRRLELLKASGEIVDFKFEGVKFRLATKTFYTPDFLVVYPDRFEVHEVKGFWQDDARVKIKVIAEQYPYFKFVAVKLVKREWQFEEF